MEEKEELLGSFEEYERKSSLLGLKDLIFALLFLAIALGLFFPKIYVANEIYYTSRKINKLLDHYEILKEENRLLKQKLEEEKFKNQVLDMIF